MFRLSYIEGVDSNKHLSFNDGFIIKSPGLTLYNIASVDSQNK
jgi:hypothetical protein